MNNFKEYLGECLGTFLLVFIGCGSVGVAILFGTFTSLWQIATVWGIGVTIAIYAVKKWSPAHLNPAVSIAFSLAGELKVKKLPFYFIGQFLGAILAGLFLYLLLANSIADFEQVHQITRGYPASVETAKMFGEFFPNPGYIGKIEVSHLEACCWEGVGTFLLIFVIFRLTYKKRSFNALIPVFIGLTVTLIICLVAPYTQAGLNPARDLGPRLVAYFAGWNEVAFPNIYGSFFTVYILSPILGGFVAHLLHKVINKRVISE